MKVSKAVFLALAGFGDAKGSLRRIDPDGLLGAARESGLDASAIAEVQSAIAAHTLDTVDGSVMSPADRVLAYGLASWFSQLDATSSVSAHPTYATFWNVRGLVMLGDKLGLPIPTRKEAGALAHRLAQLPLGERPEPYDFETLAERFGALKAP